MPKIVANRSAGNCIANREDFSSTTGNLRGERVTDAPRRVGRLNSEDGFALYTAHADYIVWSYATPIAWHGAAGWTVPDTKYTVTTSKHQGIVRRAI